MRTFDPMVHNYIANIDSVFEKIGGKREDYSHSEGLMVFGAAIAQTNRFVFLHNEERDVAMIFEFAGPGIYEMHVMFHPSCRGKRIISEGKKLIEEMFVEQGAIVLWGKPPLSNKPIQKFGKLVGAELAGIYQDNEIGDCQLFLLRRDDWMLLHGTAGGKALIRLAA